MKKAFTITELAVVLFLLILVSYFVIPNIITDTKQAQFISALKHFADNTDYAVSLNNVNSSKNSILKSDDFIKDLFEIIKIKQEDIKPVKKYKYTYLSGHQLEEYSPYKFNNPKLFDNKIIGLKKLHETCSPNEACVLMFVDLNAQKKPNKIGKDIYFLELSSNKVMPLGENKSLDEMKTSCSTFGDGLYCAK